MTRRLGWTVPSLADAYLAGGARFIQIRSKHAGSGAFLEMCEDVVARGRAAGAIVIVNDRADIAKLSAADGVHVGQDDLDPVSARTILGVGSIIGLSTHTTDQVRAAATIDVDYIAVGPIFGTATKDTGYRDVGTAFVSEAAGIFRDAGRAMPIVAIGGITVDRAPAVIGAGASAVAVISDLLSTGNPEARVREYLRALS
ncbi:MAG TPA: thiamine phosphate synthase [Vicinamibacterales bacterium]|nr:thiamine phosphate synthase [Vicinamibacterales bacterium]